MAMFKCKMCGGSLEVSGESVATCEYCGTSQTLPRLEDERLANLYDRANHFRRNNEYDKAMGMYERILTEDPSDAEAYWSLVLCRYGIEYVEDPATHKRLPTVNRAQFTSVFDDDNYRCALEHADGSQRKLYEAEAQVINDIQKGILAISRKEAPFDVFICYKETDRNGRRTPDSVLANDLYHQLTQEGFKVFFSRITLEDKLGTAYEPYIFAALNSARVMVVLGTKAEYFNAVWVRNEWSRYLALIKAGDKKVLIPAYRDMDPYDLPEEFSHLQAQDMSKLGFMQDLLRGIRKIAVREEPKSEPVKEQPPVVTGSAQMSPLLKRAFLFLEDEKWESADEYCEKVLDMDPECARAYLGKLMAQLRVSRQEDLRQEKEPFDREDNYRKAIRFADPDFRKTLEGYISHINHRNEQDRLESIYTNARDIMDDAGTEDAYQRAARSFESIPGYKDASDLARRCYEQAEQVRKDAIYAQGTAKMISSSISEVEEAIRIFSTIQDWKDAGDMAQICRHRVEELKEREEAQRQERRRQAEAERQERRRQAEAEILERQRQAEADRLERERLAKLRAQRNKRNAIIAAVATVIAVAVFLLVTQVVIPNNRYNAAAALMAEGNYVDAMLAFEALDSYKDSVQMADACRQREYAEAEALLAEGRTAEAAIAFGWAIGYGDARERSFELWAQVTDRNTVDITRTGIIALRNDGTVVASGANEYGQNKVSDWTDIVAVSAGNQNVGLKSDGTVVAVGNNSNGQCNVSDWTDIVAVYAGSNTYGVRANGTVVSTGQSEASTWTGIVSLHLLGDHTVGLRADGTVVALGSNDCGECNVESWTNVVRIAGDHNVTYGICADGTVQYAGRSKKVATGTVLDLVCDDTGGFAIALRADSDVVDRACSYHHVVTLYSNGTVSAYDRHDSDNSCCDVDDWTDIVAIWAETNITYGLRSNGTMVVADSSTGTAFMGRSYVGAWTNIKLPRDDDSQTREKFCEPIYLQAESLLAEGNIQEAAYAFSRIPQYKDARERGIALWQKLDPFRTVSAGVYHTVAITDAGTVVTVGHDGDDRCNVSGWRDIVSVSAGGYHTLGLRSDGTVVAVGSDETNQCRVQSWRDIVSVAAGYGHSVGLQNNGTVVATGKLWDEACEVSDWENIVAIAAGGSHTVGLRGDGTVVAVGDNSEGQCDVSGWRDIVAIAAGCWHTLGLRSDGTVVAVGDNWYGACEVSDWENIVAVSAGSGHSAGLRSDGTVVAVGSNYDGECDVSKWRDIVAISALGAHTVGLRSDGTVVATGDNSFNQCDVDAFSGIRVLN